MADAEDVWRRDVRYDVRRIERPHIDIFDWGRAVDLPPEPARGLSGQGRCISSRSRGNADSEVPGTLEPQTPPSSLNQLGAARGEPHDGSRYHECRLAALERLVVQRRLSDQDTPRAQKDAWADAYRRTPDGRAVTLLGEVDRDLFGDHE